MTLEEEYDAEERAAEAEAREVKKQHQRVEQARVNAFQAGRSGDAEKVRSLVETFSLDVKAPEKPQAQPKKPKPKGVQDSPKYETMMHAVAQGCGEEGLDFLLSKGSCRQHCTSPNRDSHSHYLQAPMLRPRATGAYCRSTPPSLLATSQVSIGSSRNTFAPFVRTRMFVILQRWLRMEGQFCSSVLPADLRRWSVCL